MFKTYIKVVNNPTGNRWVDKQMGKIFPIVRIDFDGSNTLYYIEDYEDTHYFFKNEIYIFKIINIF